ALNTNCTIEAVSRDSGADDGFRPIFCSLDEIHQMRDNSIYKAMYNGTRSLPETLISMITTRGKRLNSFCFEMDKYARDILMGLHTADDFFADIYCLDDEDDIWDENNWIKACPYTCSDPERLKILRQDAQTAKDMGGSDLADFLCKSLNLWVKNTDDQFINPEAWKACGTEQNLQEFSKLCKQCYVGIDLSQSGDLTSIALVFPFGTWGGHYYIYSHSFMPRGRLE
ncbi:MAG: terminase large subunit, partial [Oscillospiraceae bacterium]|nr:terminase large subunit [Oscillospiraceae bacterium]